jgi:hypothetical protein
MNRYAWMRVLAAVGASAFLMSATTGPAAADGNANNVKWQTIIGIVQPGNIVGVPPPVTTPPTPCSTACVNGAGLPWTALGGHAKVNLTNGHMEFQVNGLVLAAGNSIGTPGTVTQVKGALVCITVGTPTTAIVTNTVSVPLSSTGDAQFSGTIVVDGTCTPSNVVFLIRSGNTGNWIANGSVRTSGGND